MAENDSMRNNTFKDVPDSLEDITAQWCEAALRKDGIIDSSTTVLSIKVNRLKNDETGALDGGGMTPTQMARIKLTYGGCHSDCKPPDSIIAKHLNTGKCMFAGTLVFRIVIALFMGRNREEKVWRTDIKFHREALPLMSNKFLHPEVYYTAISDGGNRSFIDEVIRAAPHKLRSITLMQDMDGWKSQMAGLNRANFDQSLPTVTNIAAFHGSFWGDKNKKIRESFDPALGEMELRGSSYSKLMSKKRNNFSSRVNNLRKSVNKVIKQWCDSGWMTFSKDIPFPTWMASNSDEEGNIRVLKTDQIIEMLDVYVERFPAFTKDITRKFLNSPSQTLLHGDFHNGNHMYLEEVGNVKVVAFDFQTVGKGMAVSDLVQFIILSRYHTSLNEEMELLKAYHEALLSFGVTDYTFGDLKNDFIIGCFENLTKLMMDFSERTPEKMMKMFKGMMGEEKFADLTKMLDSGIACSIFLFLTSLYLRDKDMFLKGQDFLDQIQ